MKLSLLYGGNGVHYSLFFFSQQGNTGGMINYDLTLGGEFVCA